MGQSLVFAERCAATSVPAKQHAVDSTGRNDAPAAEGEPDTAGIRAVLLAAGLIGTAASRAKVTTVSQP